MSRPANYSRPVRLSLQVLRDAGITGFPVSLKQILKAFGIRLMTYEEFCLVNDCEVSVCIEQFGKDGATIEKNGKYLIVYNRNQTPKDRIRFTIAHELGHIFLHHHSELGTAVLQRLWVEKSLYDVMEDEANCFARNLLCPAVSVLTVLRAHGFVSSEYDERRKRNVWLKIPGAQSLPNLPFGLTDAFLVRQSFRVTGAAAGIRCSFLKEDLRNTPMADAADILENISFTTQWRCRKCGSPRVEDADCCWNCGTKDRFGFISSDAPAPPPVPLSYDGYSFLACPVCGNEEIEYDDEYCIICGTSLTNRCDGTKNADGELIRHPNPPFARFCCRCGKPTAYSRLEPTIF